MILVCVLDFHLSLFNTPGAKSGRVLVDNVQRERSQEHGHPYQDVGNFNEEEEQIQLEKP